MYPYKPLFAMLQTYTYYKVKNYVIHKSFTIEFFIQFFNNYNTIYIGKYIF
jgi:hypothetical protein